MGGIHDVSTGVTDLLLEIRTYYIAADGYSGPYLIPDIDVWFSPLSSESVVVEHTSYMTRAYDISKFESINYTISNYWITQPKNETAYYQIGVELDVASPLNISRYSSYSRLYLEVNAYQKERGDFSYQYEIPLTNLSVGKYVFYFNITAEDIYRGRYVGSLELTQIFHGLDIPYWFRIVHSVVCHAGIISGVNYEDVLQFIPGEVTGISASKYSGPGGGIEFVVDLDINEYGNYSIVFGYNWDNEWFFDELETRNIGNLTAGEYNKTFVVSIHDMFAHNMEGSVRFGALLVTEGFRVYKTIEVSISATTGYYDPNVSPRYISEYAYDADNDGLIDTIEFTFEVNVRTGNELYVGLRLEEHWLDNGDLVGITKERFPEPDRFLPFQVTEGLQNITLKVSTFSLYQKGYDGYDLEIWVSALRVMMDGVVFNIRVRQDSASWYRWGVLNSSPPVEFNKLTFSTSDTDGDKINETMTMKLVIEVTHDVVDYLHLTLKVTLGDTMRRYMRYLYIEDIPNIQGTYTFVYQEDIFEIMTNSDYWSDSDSFIVNVFSDLTVVFEGSLTYVSYPLADQVEVMNPVDTSTSTVSSSTSSLTTITRSSEESSRSSSSDSSFPLIGLEALVLVVFYMMRRKSTKT